MTVLTKTKAEENLCIPETQIKCMDDSSVVVCRLKAASECKLGSSALPNACAWSKYNV